MDIFNLLSYINKISLLAFFVTTLAVGYQVYVLKKEKTKEQAPLIPNFQEKNNLSEAANFTSLPNSLTRKELKKVSYSKLIFLIISLMTIMVVIFVLALIKQNSSVRNEASVNPGIIIVPTPALKAKTILSPSVAIPTTALSPTPSTSTPAPFLSPSPSPFPTNVTTEVFVSGALIAASLSPTPTEIILAQTFNLTPTVNPTSPEKITGSQLQTLPETGNIGKGLLIFGVAISTIFFSFWF